MFRICEPSSGPLINFDTVTIINLYTYIYIGIYIYIYIYIYKGKVILLQPRVAQSVGRDISLLFHDRGTRRG